MSKIKERKKINAMPIIVAAFIFVRAVALNDYSRFDLPAFLFEGKFSFQGLALLVLQFIFAVVASAVLKKLSDVYGETVSYIGAFLLAEPFFFIRQTDCFIMLVAIIGLLFVLNALREKPVIPNGIALILFLTVSTVFMKNAVFLFVMPALLMYFVHDIENIFKNTKKIVMLILSCLCIGFGVYLNDVLVSQYRQFDEFIKAYTFHQYVYYKHFSYESYFLLIFALPAIVFGVFFFVNLMKNIKHQKDDKKQNKVKNDEKSKFNPIATICATVAAYAVSVVGFVLNGSQAFYTVNFIVPIVVLVLLRSNVPEINKTMEQINNFISKHRFAFIVLLIFMNYLSVRLFYANVNNIASYVVTI